jgi:RNA polymerase sigma-70 factor (ECF subfamily)
MFPCERPRAALRGRIETPPRSPGRPAVSTETWHALVDEHWSRVVGQALRACGDGALAEDIAQEVFVKVFRNLDQHRADSPIAHWIARITSTTTIDFLRRRRQEVSFETVGPLSSPEGDPAGIVERAETQRVVRAAMLRLPAPLREVMWLTTYAAMSHADTAATLGISVRTVVTRVVAARVRLRHALAQCREAGA